MVAPHALAFHFQLVLGQLTLGVNGRSGERGLVRKSTVLWKHSQRAWSNVRPIEWPVLVLMQLYGRQWL